MVRTMCGAHFNDRKRIKHVMQMWSLKETIGPLAIAVCGDMDMC